ncbi:hypothetical protein C8J56DRAFT_935688 [Mycena floridula]|nr:hypothetical protein C8J56DRAFT_935688 [Mycena floridula]
MARYPSRSLKWERETEWDSVSDTWRFDSVKIIWGLLSAYFVSSAAVSAVGFIGVVRSKATMVRFYRDYSIADFAFTIGFTVVGAYGAFRMTTRAEVCEELTSHPELLRDFIESCELWFERAVMASVAVSVILLVARLHFLLAASYRSHSRCHSRSQRIYLLPGSESSEDDDPETALVYAPVPLHELPPHVAQDLRNNAKEAWIKKSEPGQRQRSQHQDSVSGSGNIQLPFLPDEPLLPAYYQNLPKV